MICQRSFIYLSGLVCITIWCTGRASAQNAGLQLFQEGRYIAAIQSLEGQISTAGDPEPGLYYRTGNAYLELGELCESLFLAAGQLGSLYYGLLVEEQPGEAALHYFHGISLLVSGDKQGARAAFSAAAGGQGDPYRGYARIWGDFLAGKSVDLLSGGHARQMEAAVAAHFINGRPVDGKRIDTLSTNRLSAHDQYNLLILLAGGGNTARAGELLTHIDLRLLEREEEHTGKAGGKSITYYFYNPLALKAIARYCYYRASERLSALEGRLQKADQLMLVNQKAAIAGAEIDPKATAERLAGTADALIRNSRGRALWLAGDHSAAREVWRENLTTGELAARSRAGYSLIRSGSISDKALQACRSAYEAAFQRRNRTDQKMAAYLAEAYLTLDRLAEATAVMDDSHFKKEANQPQFLLTYGLVMFRNGAPRISDALHALYNLQDQNPVARQIHNYVQGLAAADIRAEEGRGIKGTP